MNSAISHSSQWSMTGVPKVVVCSVLSGMVHINEFSNFSFQPLRHDWCKKGCVMCSPVRGIKHIKEPLLMEKNSPCFGGSRFLLYLSGSLPYVCGPNQ